MKDYLKKLKDSLDNKNESEESREFIEKINLINEKADLKAKDMSFEDVENFQNENEKILYAAESNEENMVGQKEFEEQLRKEEEKFAIIAEIENRKNEVLLYEKEIKHYKKLIDETNTLIEEKIDDYEKKYEEKYKGIDAIKN